MKKLGISLFFLLFSIPCLATFALGRGDSFCQRLFHDDRYKPHYVKRMSIPQPIEQAPFHPQPRVKLTRHLPHINAVYIQGGVDLEIMGGHPSNKIALKKLYPGLVVKVCGHALYISNARRVDCHLNPRPCIKLCIDELRELVVAGDCRINGCYLNTCCGLHINHCGKGIVCLHGPIHLARVVNSGHAVICVPCVSSCRLQVLATKTGAVKLGGSTELLEVRAFQNAMVDARGMCSHTAMIQTSDCALVNVRTLNLQAFADKMSHIYYYMKPEETIQRTTLSGNVFQVGC